VAGWKHRFARGQLAFTTDWPDSPLNPLAAMQIGVTRATPDGLPDGGWSRPGGQPETDQRVTSVPAMPCSTNNAKVR
jgi:predicted amidohydrolase YtcJ